MDKNYAIICRVITTTPEGVLRRGQYQIWKKYKMLDDLLQAWGHLEKKPIIGTSGGNKFKYQFKAIDLKDKEIYKLV